MTEMNTLENRVVWVDIPVSELDRAQIFYSNVLDIEVHKEQFGDISFCVLAHKAGNGGCLVVNPEAAGKELGILIYLNVDGRVRAAVDAVKAHGGEVLQDIHAIGPHGFRAMIRDSEGNYLALHSNSDC